MLQTIKVKKDELAIIYKDGEFNEILKAGKHYLFGLGTNKTNQIIKLDQSNVDTKLADYLRSFRQDMIKEHCIDVQLSKSEIGLRFIDEQLVEILMPETKTLFWQSHINQTFETIMLEDDYRIPEDIAQKLVRAKTTKAKIIGLDRLIIAHMTNEQIGLLFIDKQLAAIVPSGQSVAYCGYVHEVLLSQYALAESLIHEKLAEAIRQTLPEQLDTYCLEIEVGANEAGLRYEDDLLVEILAPGSKRLYWKNMRKQHLVSINLNNGYTLPNTIVQQLVQPHLRQQGVVGYESVLIAQVPAYFVGVLNVDGKIQGLLDAGISAYWRFNREVTVELVDTRLQAMEVTGQEILTKDKVNLRVNLVANWRYQDVLLAFERLSRPMEHLYRELQLGLREAIGTRTLDELLENKNIIDKVVSAHVAEKMQQYGIETASLGVKDIILPGDMKDILAQVVEAEKSAQANVIRRREETAATRSLLNTAKVMENNPVALRLKEMETLERIAERIDKISVVGGLDQVLHGLVNIRNIEAK
ncbi:slipin family protein [Neisseria sp. Ec49-e6-T10]|uniref:slipin family protein n=1 Tax=Neisseria sp. Ec49-e6-T10 TaxID=3140744 RepID=UPI003EBCF611